MKHKIFALALALTLFFIVASPFAEAVSVTVSQSGADSGTIMKGKAFTIAVSDLSESGTVSLIDTPTGFSSSEGTTKSFSSGTTSVSWTTASISQAQTGTKITANVQGTGSPTTAESSTFNVVLPPSLTVTATPATASVTAGETYAVNLNIQNSGGTTAQSVALAVSGSGMTKSSGCSAISSISAGSSSSVSCTALASTAGTITATFTATPSNADPASDTVSVTVASTGGTPPGGTTGPSGTMGAAPEKVKKGEKKMTLVPGVGIRDNAKLQAAIEKVLGKGKLSANAIENLMRLSASIVYDTEVTKFIESSKNLSNITIKIKYKGDRKVIKFMLYEKIPKAFASSSGSIRISASGATYEVVETDPEYVFTYPEMSAGEATIVFSVSKEVNTSALEQTATEIYGDVYEGLEEGKICVAGERRCFDIDLKECANDGMAWNMVRTCAYGCEDARCNPAPPGQPLEIDWEAMQSMLVVVLPFVLIVVVIAIIGVALKKRRKKKLSIPKPMPQLKLKPENLPSS